MMTPSYLFYHIAIVSRTYYYPFDLVPLSSDVIVPGTTCLCTSYSLHVVFFFTMIFCSFTVSPKCTLIHCYLPRSHDANTGLSQYLSY